MLNLSNFPLCFYLPQANLVTIVYNFINQQSFLSQHKLKSSQKDKARQFISFTQTGEKTAIHCLSSHEWKLDVAVDNYFQCPERYNRDTKVSLDRKKVDSLFNKYKGMYGVLCRCQMADTRVVFHGFVKHPWPPLGLGIDYSIVVLSAVF